MSTKKPGPEMQGEGNYEATRAYNRDTREFIESGKVEKAAKEAKKALEGPEAEEMNEAEKKGKAKAKK